MYKTESTMKIDTTKGSMKLVNGLKSTFTLAECVKNESFICRSKFLFCTMDADHKMTEKDDKIKVKLYAKVSGPLAFILKYDVKKEAKGIPTALEKLDELSKE